VISEPSPAYKAATSGPAIRSASIVAAHMTKAIVTIRSLRVQTCRRPDLGWHARTYGLLHGKGRTTSVASSLAALPNLRVSCAARSDLGHKIRSIINVPTSVSRYRRHAPMVTSVAEHGSGFSRFRSGTNLTDSLIRIWPRLRRIINFLRPPFSDGGTKPDL
jgi:hypothetical protein